MTYQPDKNEILQEFGERIETLDIGVFEALKALRAYSDFEAVQQQNDELFPRRSPEEIANEGRKAKQARLNSVAGSAAVGHETSDNPIYLAEQAVDAAFWEAA
ncbi:MAG: hypothetical protein AAB459_04570 [Patescibacteria group bacterium]